MDLQFFWVTAWSIEKIGRPLFLGGLLKKSSGSYTGYVGINQWDPGGSRRWYPARRKCLACLKQLESHTPKWPKKRRQVFHTWSIWNICWLCELKLYVMHWSIWIVRRAQQLNSSFEMFSGHLALHYGWLCAVLNTWFTKIDGIWPNVTTKPSQNTRP
jgi:hypothetical protein